MTANIYRYDLDPTGLNPDNLVSGEIHALISNKPTRGFTTTYGAFYTDSVVVYDNVHNTPLVKNDQYVCVELLQEATLAYGKEICMIILITDTSVSAEVRVQYQVLGGKYQNNIQPIVTMFETAINDHRPVDWANVLNHPLQYPPTLHQQMLSTIWGWQYVVAAIERLRNAIIVTDVPAYEALIDWIMSHFGDLSSHIHDYNNPHQTTQTQVGLGNVEDLAVVSADEIYARIPVRKYVTYDMLLLALSTLSVGESYRLEASSSSIHEGYSIQLTMTTTNVTNDTTFYWSIEDITTLNVNFAMVGGIFRIYDNIGVFTIIARTDTVTEPTRTFRVKVTKDSPSGAIVARSTTISLLDVPYVPPVAGSTSITADLFLSCCLYNPHITINPLTSFVIPSLTH